MDRGIFCSIIELNLAKEKHTNYAKLCSIMDQKIPRSMLIQPQNYQKYLPYTNQVIKGPKNISFLAKMWKKK